MSKTKVYFVPLAESSTPEQMAAAVASMDLLDQHHGRDVFADFWPDCNHHTQFDYGQQIGLGSTEYELVRV
jgi:uncharacterized Fe-S center protein